MEDTSSEGKNSFNVNDLDELIEATIDTIKLIAKKNKRIHKQQTLQTTELVHETYIRLVQSNAAKWQDKTHFLIAFSQAMRNLLTDRYRKKMALKRGEGLLTVNIDSTAVQLSLSDELSPNWVELDIELKELEKVDKDAYDIVLLRYFVGLEIAEISSTLEISERSVSRKWTFARTWLHTNLR